MALISEENKNEQQQTSSQTRNTNKQPKKKTSKNKTKLTGKTRQSSHENYGICKLPTPLYVPYTLPTYPVYTNIVYPIAAEWTPVVPLQSPIYNIQLPVVNPLQILATPLCPYLNLIPQAISPILTVEEVSSVYQEPLLSRDDKLQDVNEQNNNQYYYETKKEICIPGKEITHVDSVDSSKNLTGSIFNSVKNINEKEKEDIHDPLEFYLKLPKELFPAARALTVDPNPIIDVFCKVSNIQKHTPWILDLEFGVPNLPITRPLPTYNVKLNSINCKNTPDAIHPGFESCDKDFKDEFLFYYDCVISTWYRGYVILNNDRSVENFQSWLLLPARVLGMCWS